MKDKWKSMWKEVIVAYFRTPSRHLVCWNEKHYKSINQSNQSTGRDSNPIRPKYKSEILIPEVGCSVRPFQAYAFSALQSAITKKRMHVLRAK
jgi:hypothetical protein